MISKKHEMTLERLSALVFSFFLGSTLLFIRFFAPIPGFKFKESLEFGIFIAGIMLFEFVLLSFLNYYIIKGKTNLEQHYNLNKKKYLYSTAVVLLLTFSVSDALYGRSWLIFLRDIAITLLTVFFGPILMEKIKNIKADSKGEKTKNQIDK